MIDIWNGKANGISIVGVISYYVSTIGNITEDAIKKYIREQAEESIDADSSSTAL